MGDYKHMTDEQLVGACRTGDEQAWNALVDRYERLVYTIPLRSGMTMREAEDVFQSVWLTLLQSLDRVRDPERISAWLVTTTKRKCWERQRRVRAEQNHVNEVMSKEREHNPTVEITVEQYERQRRIRDAIATLGEPCRSLLFALYYDSRGPSYAEIGAELDMPTGSIGPTRARCLQKLRELLED